MNVEDYIPALWIIAGIALVVIVKVVVSIVRDMRTEDEEMQRKLEDWREGK